jgi:cytoskeletal protein RodZ
MGKSLDIIRAPKQRPVHKETVFDTQHEPDKDNFFNTPTEPERTDPFIFYLALGLCSVILLVVLSLWLIFFKNKSVDTTDTTTPAVIEQNTSAGNITASTDTNQPVADTTSAATPELTPPAPTATIDKAAVKVRVVNGNGRSGEATTMKQMLSDAGFTDISAGNASSRYATTVIYYQSGQIEAAKAINEIVATKYQTELVENNSVAKSYQVVVALGNK